MVGFPNKPMGCFPKLKMIMTWGGDWGVPLFSETPKWLCQNGSFHVKQIYKIRISEISQFTQFKALFGFGSDKRWVLRAYVRKITFYWEECYTR